MKTMGFRQSNGRTFPRYQCVRQPGHDNCGKVAVTKDSLDYFVAGEVLDFVARASMRTTEDGSDETLEGLEKLVREDEAGLADLTDARFVHRLIDDGEFRAARLQLQERLDENRERLVALRAQAGEASGALPPGDREALGAWWAEASIEEQGAALRAALHFVAVHPAKHRGGNRFDTSRVELRWRLDFYQRAGDAAWEAASDEERQAAEMAFDAERLASS